MDNTQKHNENVIEQFSKQAIPYSSVPAHLDALDLVIEMSGVSKNDVVLDVASGSGIITCEFAKYAKHATGIDITEAMVTQAKSLQSKNNLTNMSWVLGDVTPLKFDSHQFSIVVTRFSFHHFLDPKNVFKEMIRVCAPGGTVMVIDVTLPANKTEAYDAMEKIRDYSHASVLSTEEFEDLFHDSELTDCQKASYNMAIDLDTQLKASYLKPSDYEKLRLMIIQDLGVDSLGIDVKKNGEKYTLHYPIHIYTGRKPDL